MISSLPFLCNFVGSVKKLPTANIDEDCNSMCLRTNFQKRYKAATGKDLAFSSEKKVLILSRRFDPESDLLSSKLLDRGIDYVRIDLEDILYINLLISYKSFFSSPDAISGSNNIITLSGESAFIQDISKIGAVLLRHFDLDNLDFTFADGSNGVVQKFAFQQWFHALTVLKDQLARTCQWINTFESMNAVSNNRVRQLSLAKSVGFETPDTIITNDAKEAKEFYYSHNKNVIIKALHHHLLEFNDEMYPINGHKLSDSELHKLDASLIYAPSLLQERLCKKSELRVTVVGDQVFAAEIVFNTELAKNEDIHLCEPSEFSIMPVNDNKLYESLKQPCIELVTRRLGLRYGAIDFIIPDDNDGGHYNCPIFLEVNSVGYWLWIEHRTKQPITESLVDLLEKQIIGST